MADIRLVRPKGSRVWLIMVSLATVGLALWGSVFLFGDATAPDEQPRVGASADFGSVRAPVLPVEPVPFGTLSPIQTRDIGRLVRIEGVAESGVRDNTLWVRTNDGYRILMQFEPEPEEGALSRFGPGSSVRVNGYLHDLALAEFRQITDSLGVRVPRPPPARKFGDLPNPAFARVDSLYVKNYYISVRPEGINPPTPAEPEA